MDLISGEFAEPAVPDGMLENRSPADLGAVLSRQPWAVSQVERAVRAARAAWAGWAARPLDERIAAVRAVGASLQRHAGELAQAIALDVGKPLWEARTEVAAAIAKASVTVEEGLPLVRGFEKGAQAECRFRPLGALAVLGPFNFPVHLPNGHILPALATGNTVVFKPSEVAPHAAEVYARAVHEAGLPPGVFNLVQGGPAVGAALSANPEIDGVLFTGSWAVGQAIERATQGQAKMLALEMGGKNAAIILADADPDKALHDALFSAFVSAGQRCTAASRVIVEGPPARADAFARRLAALAARLVVGHPLDEGVFMGPLASPAALRKFEEGCAAARNGGHPEGPLPVEERHAPRAEIEVLLASRHLAPRGLDGCYASPTVHRVHKRADTPYEREELFGPDVAVHHAASLEEAVQIANATDYGLAASVHTASAAAFERCASLLQCGVINHNAPTVGASGRLPFGGLRRSGNYRPAGLFSTLYCTAPVAILRGEGALDRSKLSPGLSWVDE